MLGGVCAAVADRFGWDRSLVRILTVATLLLPGTPVIAYIAAWIIIPDEQKYWERQAAAATYPQPGYPQHPGYQAPPAPPVAQG
jgi:phage shock protein PspC (stress-responsive transcriptional regulator)